MSFENSPEINRNVLIVVPTELFLDWARNNPNGDVDLTMEELTSDVVAYLIPGEVANSEDWLQQNYENIFEIELECECIDPSFWPKDRSYEVFKKFFLTFYCSSVIDMGKGPIHRVVV